MLKKLTKENKGFTIIEVLIVLAIAGLIMLIVFLAVPALQRNSRNNARNNDASRISAAVTECVANRNNNPATCGGAFGAGDVNYGTLAQITTVTANTTTLPAANNTTTANIAFGRVCNSINSDGQASTNPRDFTILYRLEPNVARCIGSQS